MAIEKKLLLFKVAVKRGRKAHNLKIEGSKVILQCGSREK